jgi:hypothetical protein
MSLDRFFGIRRRGAAVLAGLCLVYFAFGLPH